MDRWKSKVCDDRHDIMVTPIDDFFYLVNNVLLGDEPTIEDFILLIGTFVAFVAFILWCCFPVIPKDAHHPLSLYEGRDYQLKYSHRKAEYNTNTT